MRKIVGILLSVFLAASITACSRHSETILEESIIPIQQEESNPKQEDKDSESVQNVTASNKETSISENSILIVYFSRWGNTEYPDDIDAATSASIVLDGERYGTTEYIAGMIQEAVGGDIYLIETVTPYTADFEELRDVNHKEMADGILPELKTGVWNISEYNTVFVGYPVWATDVPQAVVSFLNQYDLSEKTVIPFCTHDGYGAGNSYQTIRTESNAGNILDGLAIEAKDVYDAEHIVTVWLDKIGMINSQKSIVQNSGAAIKITIGDTVLDGVLYNTALAQEIREKLPLTVLMVGYGGREYYGGIDFTLENTESGQLYFENGDITYCSTNNTMAIFYAQTNRPNLTMEVIPIGKVTSDLEIFDTLNNREEITFSLAE